MNEERKNSQKKNNNKTDRAEDLETCNIFVVVALSVWNSKQEVLSCRRRGDVEPQTSCWIGRGSG